MKKIVLLLMLVLLVILLAACSTRQNEPDIPNSEPEKLELSTAEPLESDFGSQAEPASTEEIDNPLVKAVQSIIEQYKNGTVDTETGVPGSPGSTFSPVPEDFEFPDIVSEADFERVNNYEDIIVYIKGSGETPYMNICINSDDYTVKSVIFLPVLPD